MLREREVEIMPITSSIHAYQLRVATATYTLKREEGLFHVRIEFVTLVTFPLAFRHKYQLTDIWLTVYVLNYVSV